ncbi:hypothetical protein DPMN_187800 [Dreissena polymorpha]|uniref:Uncharacterized protein n=1 Tax=Dreissena polymorpha TaxID=45954 RepID=A0A9D4DSS1_DREPO|nr:hypothetical protein DPMN_187800 [Dreissena polymorpha]
MRKVQPQIFNNCPMGRRKTTTNPNPNPTPNPNPYPNPFLGLSPLTMPRPLCLRLKPKQTFRPSVPVAYPEIWEENQHTARLRWQRAYIPKYYSNKNIPYRVEMQEVDSQSSEWRPVASDVITRDVTIPNMTPGKDYNFRIRAQLENGDLGEPSLPIQYNRSRGLAPRHNLDEYKPVQYEAVFLSNRPYLDHLCKYVPPRMPIEKPDMITMGMDNVELTWKPARVPDVIKNTCNLTYTIEVRCPPSFEWRELASGLKVCFHHVTDLNPRVDYIFRVRAWNEYGCSEPSLPVSLYRPYDANRDELDDEEFEREWEARFGHKVPPKLPMDTPRIVTQSADTLWFTWHPARIPAYATQTQITYTIEIKEPPSNQWKRDVTGLLDCQYIREGLDPNKEYHIRVRAETEFGPSDPTLPIILKGKGSRPSSRVASSERDEIRDSRRELSYMDNIASGVPPRMASTRPISANVGPDRLTLTWSACRLPPYVKSTGATYIIEKREPPGHVWSILAKDVTCTKYEITGLNPEQDYMFRVRARNEYGVSEATLPVTLYRERDDYVPQRRRSRSGSRDSLNAMLAYRLGRRSASFDYGSVARSGSGSDDRSSTERMPEKPEIMTTVDTQYGVQGKKGQIALQVRGYPLPKIRWYKGEEKVENGDTYNVIVSSKGDIILEIKAVNAGTVGQYKCYAENNSGSAVKVVYFELAEQPTVLRTIQDQVVQKDSPVILACKIDGFPAPTVKWLKDWRPLSESAHVKLLNISSEIYQLEIMNTLDSDSGLYACVVENCAGKATVTGRLTVEADVVQGFEDVNIRSTPFEEKYHVLEEIGRGRYGVVRRVVEMATGRTYAAHFRSLRNKAQKNFFMTEFEILRALARTDGVLRIHDAFETDRTLIFVTEVLTSCDLMETLVADGNWTEAKVAETVRKLLYIMRDLEYRRILHLNIKPSNIRVCGDQLKLSGFGLSRILIPEDEEVTHNYGSVGYASPEQVTNSALSSRTDVWYIGVLVYIILYGSSPFRGASETEVLQRVSDGVWSVEDADFEGFSKEAVDFIRRLLVKEPAGRMSVEECLNHPWLGTKSETPLKMDKIRKFHNAERLKREAQKTYSSVQLQSFSKILHGTRALYQPAVDIESGEIFFPDSDEYGNYLDEDAWYEWQLQYLDDPDSQIFDIKDRAFTVRESRHAGAPKTTSGAPEEVDTGSGVMFREKIQTMSFWPGVDAVLSCTVGWNEAGGEPVITWYRDETLLTDAYRADPSFDPETGVAMLTIISPKDYDTAVYKCVARTKLGRVSCQAKLLLGDYPSNPGRPLVTAVSGSEALLTWSPPSTDGNSYLLGYRVDYRKHGEKKWTQGPYVTEEYARISGLSAESKYVFRVSCHNQYGQSPFSMASLEAETLAADAPTVTVFGDLLPFMQFTSFDKNQLTLPAQSRRASLAPEVAVEVTEGSPEERYTVFEKIASGTYGDCKISVNKETKKHYMTKVVPYNKDEHARITHEFEILRHLSHANVIAVADAFVDGASFHVMYENLCGMNIVQYLSLHKSYKEELVAKIVRQVLDALQYLQFFGIVHLNLQPSSIVMATRRCPFVKIQDFRLASRLVAGEGKRVPKQGYPDFVAPEVLKGDPIGLTTDVWTLGAVTFTLLSGLSPYGGKDLEETLSRILFDRYDKRDLYENVTSESIKFVTALMRRVPKNRPVVSRCLDSQWLQFSDSMVTSRSSRVFKTDRLRAFDECYQRLRADPAYRVDTVDIDTLPKPKAGPMIKPLLSAKIVNKYEEMMKKRKNQTMYNSNMSREEVAAEIALSLESDKTLLSKNTEAIGTVPAKTENVNKKTSSIKPFEREAEKSVAVRTVDVDKESVTALDSKLNKMLVQKP